MEYREVLTNAVEHYFNDILEKYKVTTTGALQLSKKLSLFKKYDFSGYIADFQTHMEEAEAIDVSELDIPSSDVKSKMLAEKLRVSLISFQILCSDNIKFYEIADKKQYRDSGVKASDFKEAFNRSQTSMAEAVRDLKELEEAYAEYN